MAKTKTEKENEILEETNVANVEPEEATPVTKQETVAPKSGPSYEELMNIVRKLAQEVQTLKSTPTASDNSNNLTDILAALTNRKSDREVSIVHNQELNGGLTTHIELSNSTIDFKHIGETRLLSWQQFEECSSKYRSFFDAKIILVDSAHAEVAEQYNLPCVKGRVHPLTQKDLANLSSLEVPALEAFVESLSSEDKDTVFSYWLGKCYSREPAFYNRHKMDTLNRLSQGMFDNILLVMNGDSRSFITNK